MSTTGLKRVALGILLIAACGALRTARAEEAGPEAADRIEAVQARAWKKRGAFALEPFGAYGLNDPFLIRGGGGMRAFFWPRSLLGIVVEGSGWTQTPSESARIAQRELKARMRDAGSAWSVTGSAEVSTVDGKVAFGSRLVPFELLLRGGLGAASATEDIRGSPVLSLNAAVGARWFVTGNYGIETDVTWRSASLVREVNGQAVSSRDTVVGFEVGVPLLFVGGGR